MFDILGGLFLLSSLILGYLLVISFLKPKSSTKLVSSSKPKWKQQSYRCWVYHNPGDVFIFAIIEEQTDGWLIRYWHDNNCHTMSGISTRQIAMLTVENWFN